MDLRQTLLAAIHAEPRDEVAWLALADHLEEGGCSLQGELLRLHVRLTRSWDDPQRPAWQQCSQRLLADGVTPFVPWLDFSIGRARLTAALIPPGRFLMGDDPPRLRVTVTRPFYLGVYPITQAQWRAVMNTKPSRFPGPRRPVEQTNYDDCLAFCARLSERTGRQVRLPTEAEWEYACRAGTVTRYHSGDTEADLERVTFRPPGSPTGTSKRRLTAHTHRVGLKQPNGWGLYDLHGNVWEWTSDADGGSPDDLSVDPCRSASSSARVCKGGSYGNPTRAGNRIGFMGGGRNDFIGFRVVIDWQAE